MEDETASLVKLMLQAEVFCERVECITKKNDNTPQQAELRLKISQCRGALCQLQELFDNDQLSADEPLTTSTFRYLIISLLWLGFRAKDQIDFKLFRRLITIESGFTYLLITRQKSKR